MFEQEYTRKYWSDSKLLIDKLAGEEASIIRVVDALFEAWKNRKPVFVIGNGGSAGTATHFAADLVKTTINAPTDKGVKAMALADNIPLISAATNDWGWSDVYSGALNTYWEKGGVVIAFSVHGGAGADKAGVWSQNLLKALQFAKDNGGTAVGFSGFDGGAMKGLCDISVVVPADSTPLVESFHVVLFHLITFCLKEKIAKELKHSK